MSREERYAHRKSQLEETNRKKREQIRRRLNVNHVSHVKSSKEVNEFRRKNTETDSDQCLQDSGSKTVVLASASAEFPRFNWVRCVRAGSLLGRSGWVHCASVFACGGFR